MTTITVELRELLERVAKPVLFKSQENDHANACAELRALLSEQPQAGAGRVRKARCIGMRPGMGEVTIYLEGNVPGFLNPGCEVYVYDTSLQPAARQEQGDEVRRLREALGAFLSLGVVPGSWNELDSALQAARDVIADIAAQGEAE